MPTELERQWMAAWRVAGPELERIREQELRDLDETEGIRLLRGYPQTSATSGLIAFQAWMMRLQILEAMKRRD